MKLECYKRNSQVPGILSSSNKSKSSIDEDSGAFRIAVYIFYVKLVILLQSFLY